MTVPLPDAPSAETRVTMDNIAIARNLEAGDVFHLLVYRLDDADNWVHPETGGLLYASSVCTVGADSKGAFSTTYNRIATPQTGLSLPTGNYRLCVFMTPDMDSDLDGSGGDARLVVNPSDHTFTFARGTDLLVAAQDINIPRRVDTNPHELPVSWTGVVFTHQSSKINFRIEHKTPQDPAEKLKDPIEVLKIEVSNLTPRGVSTFSLLETNPSAAFSVVPVDAAIRTDKVELAHQEDNPKYQFTSTLEGAGNDDPVVTTYPFLLIPQNDLSGIQIRVTLKTASLGEEAMTLSATSVSATFLPNMAYTFTLEIDKERPVFYCTVAPWYEGTADNQNNTDGGGIEDDDRFVGGIPGFTVTGWEDTNKNASESGVGE